MSPTLLNSTAALLSLAWAVVHLFVGGRDCAKPLREDVALEPEARHTMWMCWHMVTATLFILALLFALAVLTGDPGIGLSATLVAAGLAIAGLMSVPALKTSFRVLPQGWLFVPVVLLGGYAFWFSA
ncbi:MAG: hypothetical protein AAGH82_01765 [Pseudomonadota bacterium]